MTVILEPILQVVIYRYCEIHEIQSLNVIES